MLPKSERLTKEDFTTTRPKIFFRGELFDIAYCILPSQKFACVIAKKTLKKAVDRNRIKRRILSLVKKFPLSEKYSLIFYPKKTSLTVRYSQLEEAIKEAFVTLH